MSLMGVREITTNPKQSLQNAHHQICDDLCNVKLMAFTFLSSTRREVVVAQVVERWHSVWASRAQIPGQTLAFSGQNYCQSILSGCRAFSDNV